MEHLADHGERQGSTVSRLSLRTADLDEARAAIGATYYANFIDLLEGERRLDAAFDVVNLGPLTMGEFGFGADVRMRFGDLRAYHVDLPVSGHLLWRQGARDTATATASRAAVFHPEGHTTLERWDRECRLFAVKIESHELLRHLEGLLGRPVGSTLRLAPEMDITSGPGRSWARLVGLAVAEMGNERGVHQQPLMAGHLRDALLTGLLLATDHRYREELDRPVAGGYHLPVKRVMDAVHAHPERPLTTTELATVAGVSERWLQEVFRRQVGMSPMTYLRNVRMERAHRELAQADPTLTSVAEVAYRWGFGHLGRFAERHRVRFGELPSQTLKSS